MRIEQEEGEGEDTRFEVGFAERMQDDVRPLDDGTGDEMPAFAAVSRMSELLTELDELGPRPIVPSLVTPQAARALRHLHPGRWTRAALGPPKRPAATVAVALAPTVRGQRQVATPHNLFRQFESLWVEGLSAAVDAWRNWRDTLAESTLDAISSHPLAAWAGQRRAFERTRLDPEELARLPEVERAIELRRKGR